METFIKVCVCMGAGGQGGSMEMQWKCRKAHVTPENEPEAVEVGAERWYLVALI